MTSAAARKFGTFSGVFTPSILTILGVIMYLRLPSIVGQAGLIATIGIILIAHVISVTTGLSVASVATDRKVRGGGTYYMLSRSLGLPIGGTLGIALFVGLSFAVSLYIIGFAESFLGFWEVPATINAIRAVGVIVLVLVTGVTLVSTSLALRAQFFILAAIALSLLSIVLGVGRHELGPSTLADAALDPLPAAASFIVLFGIFFPAVTGFEAGVSMSGDLRDPKRSIPAGTIAAIGVGLVVYIALTALLAYTVDARQLATNPRVLLDISIASPLVLAGVWGATISSALGSILAAPRIMQATAIDRITPAIFGRGYGRDNEPRHALLLTFGIALVGILIGELDVIARIVSMFFITAYGFLNLACAIESWASPDFRPSFRVPRAIPVLGALACLIVMIQLDLVAMVGATLVLGGLYLYLTRKQLQLETGDAWSGFWASVARAALHRLDRGGAHRRNWRPNVIAFTLPGVPPEPVLDVGRQLAGRRGMLTVIDVVPGTADHGAVTRGSRAADGDGAAAYGVFTRVVESRDPFAAVSRVARYHGVAGMEPNALLLPWPGHTATGFDALLTDIAGIDQNLLLLAHSPHAIGHPSRIDLWWWGEPQSAVLALSLLRAFTAHDTWRTARVCVRTVRDQGSGSSVGVERRMAALLDEMRIDAEIGAVENAVAQSLADIIAHESAAADMVLIDATPFTTGARVIDGARVDALRDRLRTALFTLPSSAFTGGNDAGRHPATRSAARAATTLPAPLARRVPELRLPADATLALAVTNVHHALDRTVGSCVAGPLSDAYDRTRALIEQVGDVVDVSMAAAAASAGRGRTRSERAVRKLHGDLLFHARLVMQRHREHGLPDQRAALADFVDRLLRELDALPDTFDASIPVVLDRSAFRLSADDGMRVRAYKLMKRLLTPRAAAVQVNVPLREIVRRHLVDAGSVAERAEREFIADAAVAVTDVQALLAATRSALDRTARTADDGDAAAVAEQERATLHQDGSAMLERHLSAVARTHAVAARVVRQAAHRIAHDLDQIDASRRTRVDRASRREAGSAAGRARDLPDAWHDSQTLLLVGAELELTLRALRNRVGTIVERARDRLRLNVQNGLLARIAAVRSAVEEYVRTAEEHPGAEFTRIFEHWPDFAAELLIDELRQELQEPIEELPERIETLSPATATRLAGGEIDDIEIVTIALRPLADYHLDAEFVGPVLERLLLVPDVYARATDAAQDAVRLTAFRFRGEDGAEDEDAGRALLLSDALRRIDAGTAELAALVDELDAFIVARLDLALAGLESHRLLRETERLPQYIRARRGREALNWFQAQRRRVHRYAGQQAVRLLYQRSEAVRFARELESHGRGDGALLELVATVSPDPRLLERLPYHYRQLFLGKPGFSRDFWAGWGVERRLAAQAVAHHRRGFEGPVLVTGEPFAGKSALVNAIADEHFGGAPIYRIVPPRERTTSSDALLARIADSVGAPRGGGDPLLGVPAGAVIIFEDLDRWWERAGDGYDALDTALDLMERHGNRCVFLASADVHAFRFIDRVHAAGRRFLATIECRPFSAREIGDVIQLRHGSTGFVFEIDGVDENRLTGLARARLFNRLFDYSGGNIGAALQGWITHIAAIDGERLSLVRPVAPDLHALDALDPLHRLLLVQLILHRGLSADRLMSLGGARHDMLAAPLAELRRARAVIDERDGVLVVNPFLRPFVARRLGELELIE